MSFDINQSVIDTESGEYLEEEGIRYQDTLVELFAESLEGEAHSADGNQLGWVTTFLDYAIRYVGHTPPKMTTHDLDEVLFDIFPRKVSVVEVALADRAPKLGEHLVYIVVGAVDKERLALRPTGANRSCGGIRVRAAEQRCGLGEDRVGLESELAGILEASEDDLRRQVKIGRHHDLILRG